LEKLDLRAGKTVWEASPPPALPAEPLAGDISTDVLVVGAGISGALVAEALTAAGHAVVIVDRRGPAKGSTAASTALLLFEIDTPLVVLAKKIGPERAGRAWRRSCAAMEALFKKLPALGIECDFIPRDALLLPGNVLNAKGLRREAEARRKLGLPSEFLDGKTLKQRYGISRGGAIVSGNSAECDPVRFAAAFLRCALERGAVLHAPEEVTRVVPGAARVRVDTKSGRTIDAGHVVFATGYEVPDFIPHEGHKIISTWALATPAQHDNLWHSRCLIWEAADPYLYLRTMRGGRIVIGGEDEEFSDEDKRNALLPAKTRALCRKLGRLFPNVIDEAEFAWTGAFGKSETGLPTIGAVPGMPRCLAVLGFGGNGMTYAQLAAEIIPALVRGARDPDADLFAFGAISQQAGEAAA
jgi:glycine/D-amino acid oxidase-like deaminating enzyme